MIRLIVVTLCAAMGVAVADTPPPSPKDEKAGTDETLQNGATGARPWANGVPDTEQKAALAPREIGRRAVHRADVVHRHRARRAEARPRPRQVEATPFLS